MEPAFQRVEGTGKLSLVRKLSEVMAAVERIPKSGRNKFHGYDYATEADIVASVRMAMAERQVMLVPAVVDTKWTEVVRQKGGTERLCTLTVRFTLHDGESGEQLSFDVLGEGQDAGDKASYKAMTGAVKYALLKLFLIPTGDDPEGDDGGSGKGTSGEGTAKGAPPAPSPAKVHNFPASNRGTPSPQAAPSTPPTAEPKKPAARRPLEEARRLDRATQNVGFGKHKSLPIAALTDEQLAEALDEGTDWMKGQDPGDWRMNGMKNRMDLLQLEYEARAKVAASKMAAERQAEPARDDDVPF